MGLGLSDAREGAAGALGRVALGAQGGGGGTHNNIARVYGRGALGGLRQGLVGRGRHGQAIHLGQGRARAVPGKHGRVQDAVIAGDQGHTTHRHAHQGL